MSDEDDIRHDPEARAQLDALLAGSSADPEVPPSDTDTERSADDEARTEPATTEAKAEKAQSKADKAEAKAKAKADKAEAKAKAKADKAKAKEEKAKDKEPFTLLGFFRPHLAVLPIGAMLLIVGSVGGALNHYGWLYELLTHWRPHYAIFAVVWLPLLLFTRRFVYAAITGLILVQNLWMIVPLYIGQPDPADYEDDPKMKVVVANVQNGNTQRNPLKDLILKESPDVVALMEVDDAWSVALRHAMFKLPYKMEYLRDDNFGIAIYSATPIHRVRRVEVGPVPTIAVDITFWGKPVTLVVTHPLPPVSARHLESRNRQLRHLAALRPLFEETVVLMGDLNTTSWSFAFTDFVQRTQLVDSRQGYGIQNTWGPSFFELPLDHVLHSPDLVTTRREVGPDIGSDHRPLILELVKPPPRRPMLPQPPPPPEEDPRMDRQEHPKVPVR